MNVNAAAALLFVAIALPAGALERTAVRADRDPAEPWDAGASCSVTYGNNCTGWIWTWGGWDDEDVVGVVFDPCCEGARLVATQHYFWTGIGIGWGYTGTIAVHAVVGDGCLGETYASYPLVPWPGVDQWTGIPPGPVALTYRFSDSGVLPNVNVTIPTDHPAAGPTGPQACGLCFPSTRPIHTFYFGTSNTPLCPGSPLNDGVCDAEALFWSAQFSCALAVEPVTWGSLKNLYR